MTIKTIAEELIRLSDNDKRDTDEEKAIRRCVIQLIAVVVEDLHRLANVAEFLAEKKGYGRDNT